MTLPGRPHSMPISKARRSDSRAAAGSIRASSTTRSVSWAFRAKCLIVEITPWLCAPSIAAPTMSPVRSGSSEKYSKSRPPRGSRMRLAAPPSRTLKPLARASAPTASPCRRARARSQVDASARLDGIAVAVSFRRICPGLATPSSASVSCRAGMPRRGMPSTYPAEPTAPLGRSFPPHGAPSTPLTRASFSTWLIFRRADSARSAEVASWFPGAFSAAGAADKAAAAIATRRTRKPILQWREGRQLTGVPMWTVRPSPTWSSIAWIKSGARKRAHACPSATSASMTVLPELAITA